MKRQTNESDIAHKCYDITNAINLHTVNVDIRYVLTITLDRLTPKRLLIDLYFLAQTDPYI